MVSWACRLGALAAAALLVAGCGGGGDLVEPFEPTRQLSFGDEYSALADGGRNYGTNGATPADPDDDGSDDADLVVDCTRQPNWVQQLASAFSMSFAQCLGSRTTAAAVLYAQPGAKVADVKAQIDTHLAASGFGPKDLVTVLVGANDVLEQYARYPAVDEATLIAEVRARGLALAQQVNRIIDLDGRVIVATVPDLGLTPFALAEETANDGRAALLTRLTLAFNARLRANILNDGRRIGLALADELTQAVVRRPGVFGFSNAEKAACAVAPPNCINNTAGLVTGASGTQWLWASATLFSAGGQNRLAAVAIQRARNNPF
jgi:outer membrane lipase/esterase